jgi:hypothetical protein
MKQFDRLIEIHRDLEQSLMQEVKIPHYEVDRLVVNRLIAIRNSVVNRKQDMSYIDKTIKIFLTDDEFKAYVGEA